MASANIHDYIVPGRRAHLVGIGGVSMSPLAEVLHKAGMVITGSDMRNSATVEHLRALGIPVAIGHRGENVQGAELVIRTAAVHDENPEIAAARATGIPVFERAQAWGAIMQHYENALCISGTHGKTTTTSMATHIFMAAQADPTVMIGGTLPMLHAGYRVGKGNTIILESCEYCNSFLNFFPTVAVILNVGEDHLDFFKDLADIERSFHAFADLVPQRGYVISNADDQGARDAVAGLSHPVFTFSLADRTADCYARDVAFFDGCASFDVMIHGELYAHVDLHIPGKHNILNALAAASAAYVLGIPGQAVTLGLEDFHGAGRRFEHKGSYHGAAVYDDYAHHPAELHALLTTARSMGYDRVICAFQPHTYTRTKALFDDFVRELQLPDVTVLAEIYAAREQNVLGISSRDLAEKIPGAIYCSTLDKVVRLDISRLLCLIRMLYQIFFLCLYIQNIHIGRSLPGCFPHFQKCYRKRSHRISFQPDSRILPFPVWMCIVKILICQVITTCVPNLYVNHRNLSVVTVIQEHIKSRKQRIEYPAGNSFRFQFSRKAQIYESDRAHVIIEHPDLYSCFHPFFQHRLYPAPCIFILNCMILHENELLRLCKIRKLRLQSFDRFVKISHIRILIHRITRISFYISRNISRLRI